MTRFKRWKPSRWGRAYRYVPRQEVVRRLANELGWAETAVREQIHKERLWLLQQAYGNAVKEDEI